MLGLEKRCAVAAALLHLLCAATLSRFV